MFLSISSKNNGKKLFVSIIMLRFGETKVGKEKFQGAKTPINIWDVKVDNKVISKLVETKTSSKYLLGYLDKVTRPLV